MWWLAACQPHAPTELEGRYEVVEMVEYDSPEDNAEEGELLELEDPAGRLWPALAIEPDERMTLFELAAEGDDLVFRNACETWCDRGIWPDYSGQIRGLNQAETQTFMGISHLDDTCKMGVRWSSLVRDPERDRVLIRAWDLRRRDEVPSGERACMQDDALAEETWLEDMDAGLLLERWTVFRVMEITGQR